MQIQDFEKMSKEQLVELAKKLDEKLAENTKSLEKKVKELVVQQEELDSLRDLNNDIIKNSPLGIIIIDPTGILLSHNLAFESMFGEDHESLIGTDVMSRTDFIESGLTDLFERCLVYKKFRKSRHVFTLSETGKEYIFDVNVNPLLDDDENVQRMVLMFEDRTEQSRIKALRKRSDKNYSLKKLSIGIAKEFRRPIDKMYMDISFVINNVDKNGPAVDYVFSLKDQIHKIRNISEQLMALAEPEEEEKEICEINPIIIGHPIDILLSRMREKGFVVNLKLPEKSLRVKATPDQIKQALFNVIENARDAMPDLGILTIEVDSLDAQEGKFAEITVSDTGIGIPQENMNKIFQPFYTTRGSNSSGLGLMVLAHVIENLKGHIGIKSSPGKGTVFKLMIPEID
jgi:PAS domain S-box-containing protein